MPAAKRLKGKSTHEMNVQSRLLPVEQGATKARPIRPLTECPAQVSELVLMCHQLNYQAEQRKACKLGTL
jgi:hypothetical protein